jgi:hypothetical protein
MKNLTSKTAFIILLVSGLFFDSCKKDDTISLPSELFGSWSKTSSHYVDTFTFTATTVKYYGYSEYHGGWDGEVAEVWLSENIFRMTDNMYFGWHIEGTTLYLHKTNPDATKPILTGEWWNTASYVLHKSK